MEIAVLMRHADIWLAELKMEQIDLETCIRVSERLLKDKEDQNSGLGQRIVQSDSVELVLMAVHAFETVTSQIAEIDRFKKMADRLIERVERDRATFEIEPDAALPPDASGHFQPISDAPVTGSEAQSPVMLNDLIRETRLSERLAAVRGV
ncbi:MAG: hypothetical protein AAFQ55_18405 [Pseudomonadota bacterium]